MNQEQSCKRCKGHGQIFIFSWDTGEREVTDCPKCHGTGKTIETVRQMDLEKEGQQRLFDDEKNS